MSNNNTIDTTRVDIASENTEARVLSIIVSRLKSKGYPEDKLKTLKAKQVQDDVFIIGTDRIISTFYNGRWEAIFNLGVERESYYFNQASFLAGYREFPSETKPMELYHLRDLDDKGNPLPGAKPIDKFSNDYYQAFMEISFYDDRLILDTFLLPDAIEEWQTKWPRTYSKVSDKLIFSFIDSKVVRIKDLVELKKHEQVTDSLYTKVLSILQSQLIDSIGDSRFERVNRGVTQEELDFYFKNNLIPEELYGKATARLKQFHDVQETFKDKRSDISNITRASVTSIKNEIGTIT